jgi:hypothetical protein
MSLSRWLVIFAGLLGLLAACGGAPDVATPALQGLLHAGRTVEDCPRLGIACTPSASGIAGVSVIPDGTRVAVEYSDGHVDVWDLINHQKLLSTPPQQTLSVWLTGGGKMLVIETSDFSYSHSTVELWTVGHPRMAESFPLAANWVWIDPGLSRMLVVPNLDETCRNLSYRCQGGGIIWYDLRHSRVIYSLPGPAAFTLGSAWQEIPQPPNLTPSDVEFDQATGTFAMASSAQEGFVEWKPGAKPVGTDAKCVEDGALTSDGQLFACISGAADALSLWSVPQRRLVRQILLPDYVTDNQQVEISSVTFADGGRLVAVAEGREHKPYVIRLYRVSDFKLMQTLTLGKAPNQFFGAILWSAGQSLVAKENTSQESGVYYVFSVAS